MSDEEQAYERAEHGYTLFGETLRPYSLSRKDAAGVMGLTYPFLTPEDRQRMISTGRYSRIKPDAAIVLWLCSLPDTEELDEEQRKEALWTPERAFSLPSHATLAAMAWINSKPFGDQIKPEFTEAAATMFAIIMDKEVSDFWVRPEGPKAEKKSTTTPRLRGRKS